MDNILILDEEKYESLICSNSTKPQIFHLVDFFAIKLRATGNYRIMKCRWFNHAPDMEISPTHLSFIIRNARSTI